jgi:general secretion pathway protein B
LEDTNNYAQNIDQGLSEQFNRSLFLPSVQELPEAWQYYGKKAAVAGLVVVGGFSIGWVIANMAYLGKWIGNSGNQTSPIVAIEQPITPAPIEEKIENQVPVPEAIPAPEPEIEELDEGQVRKRLAELEKEKLAKLEAERMQQLQEEALQEQAIKAQQDEAPRADISPDLLRRFQDALQDIGEVKPQGPAVDVRPIKDVPPVEELPAWVLTQLPNLSFSAHMYVSEPSERWVRVNGKRVKEGVEIEDGLMLVSIEPQHVIMTFKSQEFSMDALSDW